MKCSRKSKTLLFLLGIFSVAAAGWAAIPEWIQNIDARSVLETVIFRKVLMPRGEITVRRPPVETIPALGDLIQSQPHAEELYSLKAREEEQALDFKAAEADWKLYLDKSGNRAEAQLALADFYHRRHRPLDEVNALAALGRMPAIPSEKFTALPDERSWKAFERIFKVIQAQALGKAVAEEQYKAWIERYPKEQPVYSRYFEFLLAQKDFKAAQELITKYQGRFPNDEVFLIKARALLAYKQGAIEQGLAVYERSFQPLLPEELQQNYFELLTETHTLPAFLKQARKALEQNPDDLNAAARIFFYYREQGNLEAAEQSLTEYRLKKESRGARWTAEELYTLATLLERSQRYPEAARYYFALYNSGDQKGAEQALSRLTNILLTAPEQQIRFGGGDLSMYSNIATMDNGPGYLNGILSLILNDTEPAEEYGKEEKAAVAYFHRARAAELLARLDQRLPNSESRPGLHAQLIQTYLEYGQYDAVIQHGREFLAAFPQAEQRARIGLLMADVYQGKSNDKEECAIYRMLLKELASKADGMPLGENVAGTARYEQPELTDEYHDVPRLGQEMDVPAEQDDSDGDAAPKKHEKQAFALATQTSGRQSGARSPEYARVLDRYLSRLAQQHAIAEALGVMRGELDRNPDDPGLYERFAQFLEQNALGSEEEAVYKRAIEKFPGTSWYEKLARWYLRKNRQSDFQSLTDKVAEIFSGTDLESYFEQVRVPSSMSLALERYAHQRFPHNLQFVRDLLCHYQAFGPSSEWEALLRQYWYEDESLRNMFFEFLSRKGQLDSELAQLKTSEHPGPSDWPATAKDNPAAARFVAEAELWKSHYEEAAPALGAVAGLYPADKEVGREASSVYRSLAYFSPRNTATAVGIETNLLKANPLNRDGMARIGDIYADQSHFIQAVPYWNRMPQTEPGNPEAYEEAATVFWDYYMFDDALRLLEKGRARLNDSALYSYQEGAIYESKRDYARAAAEYVKGAVEKGNEAPSYSRLIQLAARKSSAAPVDAETAKAVEEKGFAIEAIRLRADVLRAQSRTAELGPWLDSLVTRVDATESLQAMDALALERGLKNIHSHILEREANLSSDPIRKMRLQYELASFYESEKNLAAAEQKIESLYRENPRILGVVRATVDFYWRTKQPRRAIGILHSAAEVAYPELRNNLKYEEARKMTETGEYEASRQILAGLLEESPRNGEYLAAVADTFARAGDNAGLRDFYLKQIAAFRQANLPAGERKSRLAELRRGLIPALTAIKEYAGAVDQYIELINAYPDDEALSSEAILYSLRHGRTAQILNFYKKTVANSPQDSRWAVVLARMEAAAEDQEGAIQTYSHAIDIRPDRIDLLATRAGLEERLMRFDEAAADYATLYERSFHDSAWMEKEAEIRARQNKPELAVKALETAFVEGRPKSASSYARVAEHLESWNLLDQARIEAEKGIEASGSDLLADWTNHSLAQIYVRIMTRLRMHEAALARLENAVKDANILPSWSQEAISKGMNGVTQKEWREGVLNRRINAARSGMTACMESMGSVVAQFFAPEDKQRFVALAEKKNAEMSRQDAHDYLLPLARKGQLAEFQAKLMYEGLESPPSQPYQYSIITAINDFVEFQTRRLRLSQLGEQLEKLESRRSACSYVGANCLKRAADVYHLANLPEDEWRVLQNVPHWNDLDPDQRQRYFELLLTLSPETLVEWSTHKSDQGNESADFILAHASNKLALRAIDSRSKSESPVWKPAYIALAGLYLNDSSPEIKAAFLKALDDETIGQRLKVKGDRDEELAGDTWFYYASRYGEYLEMARGGEPDDFLAGELEHAPANPGAYFDAALTFEQYHDWPHAIEDYRHVLELAPDRVDAHNHVAEIYWKQKQKDAAIEEIKQSLAALKKQNRSSGQIRSSVDLKQLSKHYVQTAEQIKTMGLFPELRLELVAILHDYVKVNSYYRVPEMIAATVADRRDRRAATNLVLELSRSAADQVEFLEFMERNNSRLKLEPEPVIHRLVEALKEQLHARESDPANYLQSQLQQWQMTWLEELLKSKQYDRLRDEMRVVEKSSSDITPESLLSLQVRLAAATGQLDSALSAYSADPVHAPSDETLKNIARELQDSGEKQSARKVLEFVYQHEIADHQLNIANMLGLAEIRIENGDLPAGLELLRRMTLVAGGPFEAQDPAAELLMRTGHANEAIPFLQQLVIAVPWNPEYRVRLAEAKLQAKRADSQSAIQELATVASDPKVVYELRIAAAKALSGGSKVELGSHELNLMATGSAPAPVEANQQFYFAARLRAAEHAEGAARSTLLRAALEDYPDMDSPRLPLMKAAMKAREYHLAIATMKPFLHNHWLEMNSRISYYDSSFEGGDEEDNDDEGAPATDVDSSDSAEFAPTLGNLSVDEKAEICEQVGLAFQKLGVFDEALISLTEATALHPGAAIDKRIKAEMREVKGVLQEIRANKQRQPSIHDALEQDQTVRPRLASGKPELKTTEFQGGHQ